MKKLTRRQIAEVAGAATLAFVAARTLAQAPPAPGTDWDKAARESHRENSETLAKFEVPMSVEPAFHFRA